MEIWEKEYIRSNLVSLVDEIDSSAILVYLLQSSIVSRLEADQLDIIGRTTGLMAETRKLLDIIRGRINGYQNLVKALYITKQTGPMITLLYGVTINTLANPFQYCGIELRLDEILSKKVNFGGFQMPLSKLCKDFNELQLNALRQIIDVSIYKCLIGGDEVTVAENTIPPVIPYYIKRTLTFRNKLDPKIFKERQLDYFLIENIEPYQLTKQAQTCQPQETASSDQLHTLTARFILFENEQHFDYICNRSKRESIHLIKFLDKNFFLIRSSKPENVKSYILNEDLNTLENEFLRFTSDSHPVIIFDTPGMGKSAVLTNLAYQLKQQIPTEYVIYFVMQDLVNRLVAKNCEIAISLIESEILDTISTNKLGSFINKVLFNKPRQVFHLFLDAFDEINSEHQDEAVNVIKILNNNKLRFKIYITSRPHQGGILEKICGVIGYGILPFQLQEQIAFLVEYWQKQYDVDSSEEVKQFAKNLLSIFKNQISSKDREITGIPLQCRMLADVYANDALSKLFSLKNSKIRMNTIYDMYREYFCQKFPKTLLKSGKSQLLDLHFKLALDLLFPESSKNINFWQEYQNDKEVFATGIIELSRSGEKQFVHRTFAEFLVAEFVGSLMYVSQTELKIPMKFVLELCFSKVLEIVECNVSLTFDKPTIANSVNKLDFSASKFKFRILAFFFDHCTSFYAQQTKIPIMNEILRERKNVVCPKACKELLFASIENNSIELYKLVSSLPREHFTMDIDKIVSFRSSKNSKFDKSCITFVEFALLLASQCATTDLLNLHHEFISSLINKPLTDLKYEVRDNSRSTLKSHPILISSQRGDYQNFEFILNNLKPEEVHYSTLIYFCLNKSYTNSSISIKGKLQILKFLFCNQTNIDTKQVSLFFF